jgi:hypothetical protein
LNKEQEQLKKAFVHVFTSPEGKLVLAALKARYYDFDPQLFTNEEAQYTLGQRSVIADILYDIEVTHE